MMALTGNQPREQALTHAGGFPEKGSHSHERADVQPARSCQGFLSSSGLTSRTTAAGGQSVGNDWLAGHTPVNRPACVRGTGGELGNGNPPKFR